MATVPEKGSIFLKKKILVFGAGSLGCYLAAKLYSSGHDVDVIGRSKAKAIGDTLYINDEAFKFPKVIDKLEPHKSYDYVFITSKYYDLKKNLEQIIDSGIRTDLIVLIQNTYIDNSWYISLIKNTPFVIVSVFEGYNLNANKLTVAKSFGWYLDEDILSKDVYTIMKNATMNVHLTEDIDIKRAEKTVLNCSVNILSTLEEKPIKDLFADKRTLKEMQKIFDESYEVLSEIIPMHSRRSLWNTFCAWKTLDHYTTTYQDVKRNKKTEVSFINGYIIELGRKIGFPTPYSLELVNRFRAKYPDLY